MRSQRIGSSAYTLVEISPTVTDRAMQLVEKHYLRGYDAVHLAAALLVQGQLLTAELLPLTFVSADVEQLKAASAEGMLVENPDDYS